MMQFHVKNRYSGEVQFTAEIDCTEVDATSKKLGLAVKWAVENEADLRWADLRWAYLRWADLRGAYLRWADLRGANLARANLTRAGLEGANLRGANLRGANLEWANLRGANLEEANLRGANLGGVNGINDWVKCIQIETYAITYTADVLQIGCEQHPIADWRNFDSRRIAGMDGKHSLKFWAKYKDWIFQTIELCPARPTGAKE